MNALIVEGEELSVRRLRKLLSDEPHAFRVAGETRSTEKAALWLEENRLSGFPDPELIFLDIELLEEQCCSVFRKMNLKSVIVFTTSYDEYIFQMFRTNGFAYLLKPFYGEDLVGGLEKYEQWSGNSDGDLFDKLEKLLVDLKSKSGKRSGSSDDHLFGTRD